MVLLTWFIFAKVDVDGAGLRGASEAPEGKPEEGSRLALTESCPGMIPGRRDSVFNGFFCRSEFNCQHAGSRVYAQTQQLQQPKYLLRLPFYNVDFVDCKWQSCDAESTEIGDFN